MATATDLRLCLGSFGTCFHPASHPWFCDAVINLRCSSYLCVILYWNLSGPVGFLLESQTPIGSTLIPAYLNPTHFKRSITESFRNQILVLSKPYRKLSALFAHILDLPLRIPITSHEILLMSNYIPIRCTLQMVIVESPYIAYNGSDRFRNYYWILLENHDWLAAKSIEFLIGSS